LLACYGRGTGVGADEEGFRPGDGRIDGHHHIRPRHADDHIDLVRFNEFINNLPSDIGLLLIIFIENLGRA